MNVYTRGRTRRRDVRGSHLGMLDMGRARLDEYFAAYPTRATVMKKNALISVNRSPLGNKTHRDQFASEWQHMHYFVYLRTPSMASEVLKKREDVSFHKLAEEAGVTEFACQVNT